MKAMYQKRMPIVFALISMGRQMKGTIKAKVIGKASLPVEFKEYPYFS